MGRSAGQVRSESIKRWSAGAGFVAMLLEYNVMCIPALGYIAQFHASSHEVLAMEAKMLQRLTGCPRSTFTKQAMFIILGSNVINIILNYILIFGKFGFPQFGLEGAGIATLMSRIFMVLLMVLLLKYHSKLKCYFNEIWDESYSRDTGRDSKFLELGHVGRYFGSVSRASSIH